PISAAGPRRRWLECAGKGLAASREMPRTRGRPAAAMRSADGQAMVPPFLSEPFRFFPFPGGLGRPDEGCWLKPPLASLPQEGKGSPKRVVDDGALRTNCRGVRL